MDKTICDHHRRSDRRSSGSDNRSGDICLASGYGDTLATTKGIANAISHTAARSNIDAMSARIAHRIVFDCRMADDPASMSCDDACTRLRDHTPDRRWHYRMTY